MARMHSRAIQINIIIRKVLLTCVILLYTSLKTVLRAEFKAFICVNILRYYPVRYCGNIIMIISPSQ